MDHYLDVEFDLSKVFFIATANVVHTIPQPLQDRMEVLRLEGYTEPEKLEIAKRFLVPKQEAGVRNLEREIGNVSRKIARKVVNARGDSKKSAGTQPAQVILTPETVSEFLGPQKFRDLQADKKNEVGATVGLAWTEVGGSILTTEAAVMEGKGKLQTTGKLGDVMQESAHAAMSYVRSRAHLLGIPGISTAIWTFTCMSRKARSPRMARRPESRSQPAFRAR
jgi:ATP-dependent Lon protease